MVQRALRNVERSGTARRGFRGKGVLGQDWITNGGHNGYWNALAIDMRGLDSDDAEQLNDANENESACWLGPRDPCTRGWNGGLRPQ